MPLLINIISILLQTASNMPVLDEASRDAVLNASPYNPITYGVLVLVLGFVAWLGVREIIKAKDRAESNYDNLMKDYLKLSQDSITTLSKVEDKIKTLEATNRSVESIRKLVEELKLKIELGVFNNKKNNDSANG